MGAAVYRWALAEEHEGGPWSRLQTRAAAKAISTEMEMAKARAVEAGEGTDKKDVELVSQFWVNGRGSGSLGLHSSWCAVRSNRSATAGSDCQDEYAHVPFHPAFSMASLSRC